MVFYQKHRQVTNTVTELQTCLCPYCTQLVHSSMRALIFPILTPPTSSENSRFRLSNHLGTGFQATSTKPSVFYSGFPLLHHYISLWTMTKMSTDLTPALPKPSLVATQPLRHHWRQNFQGDKQQKQTHQLVSTCCLYIMPPLLFFHNINTKHKTT